MSTALTAIKLLGQEGEGHAPGDYAAADAADVRETPASARTSPSSHAFYLSPSPPVSEGAGGGDDNVGGEGLMPRAARVPGARPACVWTVGTRVLLEFLEIASDSPCSSAGGLTPVGLAPVGLTPVVRNHLAVGDSEHACPEKVVKAPSLLCHGPLRQGSNSRHGPCYEPPRRHHAGINTQHFPHSQPPATFSRWAWDGCGTVTPGPGCLPCKPARGHWRGGVGMGHGWHGLVWDCHAQTYGCAMKPGGVVYSSIIQKETR